MQQIVLHLLVVCLFSVFVGRMVRDLFSNRLILIGSTTASHVRFFRKKRRRTNLIPFSQVIMNNGSPQ